LSRTPPQPSPVASAIYTGDTLSSPFTDTPSRPHPSFPTRRSSDLTVNVIVPVGGTPATSPPSVAVSRNVPPSTIVSLLTAVFSVTGLGVTTTSSAASSHAVGPTAA